MSKDTIVLVKIEELTCPKIELCDQKSMSIVCYCCGAARRRLISLAKKMG